MSNFGLLDPFGRSILPPSRSITKLAITLISSGNIWLAASDMGRTINIVAQSSSVNVYLPDSALLTRNIVNIFNNSSYSIPIFSYTKTLIGIISSYSNKMFSYSSTTGWTVSQQSSVIAYNSILYDTTNTYLSTDTMANQSMCIRLSDNFLFLIVGTVKWYTIKTSSTPVISSSGTTIWGQALQTVYVPLLLSFTAPYYVLLYAPYGSGLYYGVISIDANGGLTNVSTGTGAISAGWSNNSTNTNYGAWNTRSVQIVSLYTTFNASSVLLGVVAGITDIYTITGATTNYYKSRVVSTTLVLNCSTWAASWGTLATALSIDSGSINYSNNSGAYASGIVVRALALSTSSILVFAAAGAATQWAYIVSIVLNQTSNGTLYSFTQNGGGSGWFYGASNYTPESTTMGIFQTVPGIVVCTFTDWDSLLYTSLSTTSSASTNNPPRIAVLSYSGTTVSIQSMGLVTTTLTNLPTVCYYSIINKISNNLISFTFSVQNGTFYYPKTFLLSISDAGVLSNPNISSTTVDTAGVTNRADYLTVIFSSVADATLHVFYAGPNSYITTDKIFIK